MKILLTSCSAGLKPYEAFFFKNVSIYSKNIEIYGCDFNPKKNEIYDEIFTVPMGNSSQYIDCIFDIVKTKQINFIIPSSDEESLSLSKHRKVLLDKYNCIPLCSNYETLLNINDKLNTYDICKKNNIPVADYKFCDNIIELKKNISYFNEKYSEFVLKPNNDRGGRGIFVVSKNVKITKKIGREIHINTSELLDQLDFYFKSVSDYIIMEKLLPPCHDIDVLCNKGNLVESIIRKRIRSEFPNEGHIIIKKKEFLPTIVQICKIFDLNYLHDLDFMVDIEGNFKLIEINPRISGSTIISSALGYRIFDNLITLAKNENNFQFCSKVGTINPNLLESFYKKYEN